MLFRCTACVMILVMAVTTVAPAQIWTPRRTRDPFRGTVPTAEPAASEQAEAAAVPGLLPRAVPRGLDAPIDPATYVIGPGDEFVLYLKPQQKEVPLRVLPEGTVLVPNAGIVRAADLTIEQFRAELARELSTYYRGSELILQLVTPRTFIVYVLGEVKLPGPVELAAPFRLDAAVEAAGGVTDRGTTRAIAVREAGAVVRTADLLRFQRLGDISENPVLHERQSVYVPSRGAQCEVVGEVWRGGLYEIRSGETVLDVVALAGGFTSNAERSSIVIEKLSPDDEVSITKIDESLADSIAVNDRDAVVVPDKRSFPGIDFVRIQGGGGRDGRIHLAKGETLESFLPRFIRLRNDHDLARSNIERKRPDGKVEFIPVDLSKLVAGDKTASVALRSGDVINIPKLDDVVFVAGEVVRPGELEFQRGLPAGRYVAMAGGPTEVGSVDKLEIYDGAGNRRSGDRDSVVYRGETVLVKRRTSVILGNVFLGLVSVSSLVLSVYAVIRN